MANNDGNEKDCAIRILRYANICLGGGKKTKPFVMTVGCGNIQAMCACNAV
jgi:hypothetical protein